MLTTEQKHHIRTALAEDIGSGDLTAMLIQTQTQCRAFLIAREQGVFCGTEWFEECFRQVDNSVKITWLIQDGNTCQAGQRLCEIQGNARSVLTAERTAMNFVQTLSATATRTAEYVKKIAHTRCKLLDTRKTLPGFRLAQKYAVRCGGGYNHRQGLYDAILIKENHIAAAGSIAAVLEQAQQLAQQQPQAIMIEIEVENLQQLQQAIDAGAQRILLDNFSPRQLEQAVSLNCGRCDLEASGNITLDNIHQYAQTGIDYISVGAITKHIKALDLSLQIEEGGK